MATVSIDVVSVQPTAIVDQCVTASDEAAAVALLERAHIDDDLSLGGSHPLTSPQHMGRLLEAAGTYTSHPGGSASNVLRAVARFGASARLVGARGDDADGKLYEQSISDAGICTKHLQVKRMSSEGAALRTASCCVVSSGSQRTMRTMFIDTARLDVGELRAELLENCKYLFVSSYNCYFDGMIEKLMELGAASGCKICLDLASFEIVSRFSTRLDDVLGNVDICVCNEDEAAAFSRIHGGKGGTRGDSHDAYDAYDETAWWMLGHGVKSAVIVTLGEKGSILYQRDVDSCGGGGGCRDGMVPFRKTMQPAIDPEGPVVDATGAGDAFCAGLLYALSKGKNFRESLQIGSAAGAAAVKCRGADLDDTALAWFRDHCS